MMFNVRAGLFEFLTGCIRSEEKYLHVDSKETSSRQKNELQAATGECAIAATDGQKWSRPQGRLHASTSA